MFSMVEEEELFFYNSQELSKYIKTARSQRYKLPGYHYFSKIERFINDHSERGELFIEYRLGGCSNDGEYVMCQFCTGKITNVVARSPRPYPDYEMQERYKYLELKDTQMRQTDDFAPRVNLKSCFNADNISAKDERTVQQFCKKIIVDQRYVLSYLKHLELLELKKMKRQEEKRRQEYKRRVTPKEGGIEEDRDETVILSSDIDSDDSESDEEVVIAVVDGDSGDGGVRESVTRFGRQCTTYKGRIFFVDSD